MDKLLQTRNINIRELCSTGLINDIKEATSCEVKSVCRYVCSRCHCMPESVDVEKIKIKGLSSYSIKLKKSEDSQLFAVIVASNLDNWLMVNNLTAQAS